MDKINKIYAFILNRTEGGLGSAGNCQVVTLIRNNIKINDEAEIRKYIHTNGKIFSNKIFENGSDFKVNDLIEIIPYEISSVENDETKNCYVKIKSVKKAGFYVFDIPSEYFHNDFIDLVDVKNYLRDRNLIEKGTSSFFLSDHNKIYGSFKFINDIIQPKVGSETFSFEYNIEELIEMKENDVSILIAEPKVKLSVVDCMNQQQLMEFLKKKINADSNGINLIKKLQKDIKEINNGHNDLDIIRLKRASKSLDKLELSFDELNIILTKEGIINNVILKVVENYKNEFKNFALDDINTEIKAKEGRLLIENEKINKLIADFDSIEESISNEKQAYQDLLNKKDDLILNIKLMAGLGQPALVEDEKDKITHYYEMVSQKKDAVYNNVDEFYDFLKERYNFRIKNRAEYEDALLVLKNNCFIIASNMEFTLNTISHLGQCEVLIQNAEPDWLKFDKWYVNGLQMFLEKALNEQEKLFFYILQDFNVGSFECYGKPILDISNNIRSFVPGTQEIWPSNFHLILLKTDEEIENFGFPLNRSTFRKWKFFPFIGGIEKIIFPNIPSVNLKEIVENRAFGDYSEQYF